MTNALSVIGAYDANDDFKDMRAKDHILPRAILMQPLSSAVMDGKANAGAIVDSSTHTVLVPPRDEGKFIVPIMMWLEWIEWNRDRDCPKDKKVVERSIDPASKLAQRADRWETYVDSEGRKKPTVTEYYNFIVAVVDDKISDYENLYILGFARSSHTTGKTLLNRLFKTKIPTADGTLVRAPMFLNRIAIKTAVETKDSNKYWVPVLGDSKQNPDAQLAQLAAIASEFKARRSDIIERNRSDVAEVESDASGAAKAAASEM